MNDTLFAWAIERGGFFTRAEAIDSGIRDAHLRDALRTNHLTRLRHGYYSPTTYVGTLDATQRHALLARAVHHRLGDRYVLAGVSACAVQGIELWSADLDTVHVARIEGRTGRREAGVRYHDFAIQPSTDLVRVRGALAMAPSHAVWQASCEEPIEGALVCMNSALHRKVVTGEELAARMPQFERWQGSRGARIAHRLADARIETVGESRMYFLCWEFHLPWPEPQFEIFDSTGRLVGRTDFAWEAYRHVAEFDGKVKYVRYQRPGETISDVVLREKTREDLIRAELFGVTRVIWIELAPARRLQTAYALGAALEQSRRLYARNREVFV